MDNQVKTWWLLGFRNYTLQVHRTGWWVKTPRIGTVVIRVRKALTVRMKKNHEGDGPYWFH